ncbi:MAG: bifunctional methylenetetrahydrofolate dehydrogenase/methenyltetrahydrofolate cyclohydrolase FolD [Candidatus Aenigmatarchaeota archaeon]
MTARIMDGRRLSSRIISDLKKKAWTLSQKGIVPRLDIILVGDDDASKIYVRNKMRASEQIGIKGELHKFPEKTNKEKIIREIKKLNANKKVHGILIQLPLPQHLDEQEIVDKIDPAKDVDGLTTYSIGRLTTGSAGFESCTPKGIIRLIENEKIKIEGRNAVVIGRSNIVGKPISLMLLRRNATVTICHSKTKRLHEHTKNADIIIAAVGKANFLKEAMVKKGAVVIDVGMNRDGGKMAGDVDFDKVKFKASYITPVPGGVGPMTVAMLMENTLKAALAKL